MRKIYALKKAFDGRHIHTYRSFVTRNSQQFFITSNVFCDFMKVNPTLVVDSFVCKHYEPEESEMGGMKNIDEIFRKFSSSHLSHVSPSGPASKITRDRQWKFSFTAICWVWAQFTLFSISTPDTKAWINHPLGWRKKGKNVCQPHKMMMMMKNKKRTRRRRRWRKEEKKSLTKIFLRRKKGRQKRTFFCVFHCRRTVRDELEGESWSRVRIATFFRDYYETSGESKSETVLLIQLYFKQMANVLLHLMQWRR